MRWLFVTDPLDRLDAEVDTSVGLMLAAQDAGGIEVWVTGPEGLSLVSGRLAASARRIEVAPQQRGPVHRWVVRQPWCRKVDGAVIPADEFATVMVRLDPPVDPTYLRMTYLLDALATSPTTQVVNRPDGLRHANEKLFALRFPDLCPPTLVTADHRLIVAFVDEHDTVVVKPVDGHAGRGVLLVRRDDPNQTSIIEGATRGGVQQAVVQAYLPEVTQGNTRLFVLDGEVLGAVTRRPDAPDFRIGPPVAAAEVTPHHRAIVDRLDPHLDALGLRFVGLDVIGDRLIEVNVTSPGGLHKADGLLGTDFCGQTVRQLCTSHLLKGATS